MSTHNICLYGELEKIIPELSSNTPKHWNAHLSKPLLFIYSMSFKKKKKKKLCFCFFVVCNFFSIIRLIYIISWYIVLNSMTECSSPFVLMYLLIQESYYGSVCLFLSCCFFFSTTGIIYIKNLDIVVLPDCTGAWSTIVFNLFTDVWNSYKASSLLLPKCINYVHVCIFTSAMSENVPSDMCTLQRFWSDRAFAQSDQNLHWAYMCFGCKVFPGKQWRFWSDSANVQASPKRTYIILTPSNPTFI